MTTAAASGEYLPRAAGRRVTAVLGPTNTGKTHLAVERMLAHETGMIGLPLRLLAREVYDRVVALRGPRCVALITGEEKIVPDDPKYFVCTVEAMPAAPEVEFLAIDEIQLAADPDRGHIFTDRLLHRRGQAETMVLGAATIRPLVEKLLPGANFITRPRFSKLTYAGHKKITRLPRRSAIVTFSADSVYAIAELIRRQRGGAAVVLGALSPRTRNAQVALYQSGDVDFVVATDAIGMGLNMDIDHVAFAATRKFDGQRYRDLEAAELAQIAGRAGRHMNDGTFGVTADAEPFDSELIDRIENHAFKPLDMLQWRSRDLDFTSLKALRTSLIRPPTRAGLARARIAADVHALEFLMRDHDVRALATTPAQVARLWDVCQLPDYRNITGGDHANLIGRLFRFLSAGDGFVPDDWFARQLSYADRADGDIDTVANRIAHIRTWTFVANRADWLRQPGKWRDRAKAIEDKLSDALHQRLAQRFIDRRTSVLMKRLREKEDLMAAVSGQGEIVVEGEHIGHLTGFRFIPDSTADGVHGKALRAASMKVIAQEMAARAEALARAGDPAFALSADGELSWQGEPVARLKAGDDVLRPQVQLIADEQLSGAGRDAVQARLERFVTDHIAAELAPLLSLSSADDITGLARGIAFRLVESLGVLVRDEIADDIKQLDQDARRQLRKHGVRFGAFHIFVPALLKPAPTRLRLLLWALQREKSDGLDLQSLPAPPPDGLTSVGFDRATPRGFYQTVGYRLCGARAVRIDMLERLGDLIRTRVFWKPENEGDERPEGSMPGGGFTVTADMMSLVGCSGEDFAGILRTLGFRAERRPVERQPDGAAPPAAAQAAQASGQPSATGEPDAAAAAQPAAHSSRPEEAAAAEPASGEPQTVSQPEAAGTPAGDGTAAPAGEPQSPASDDAGEPAVVEVWWPRKAAGRNAPRRAGAAGRKRAPAGKPHAKAASGKSPTDPAAGARSRKPKRKRTAPPPRPRSQAAPADSPFAVLGALKKALEDGSPGE